MENERVHRSCSQDCCAPFSSERDRVKSRIFADASTRSWNLSSVLISSRYRTSRLVKFRASKPRLSASCFTSLGNRLKSRSIIHLVGFVAPKCGGKSRGSNNNDSLALEPPAQDNVVLGDKAINNQRGNRSLREAGLVLKIKPHRPQAANCRTPSSSPAEDSHSGPSFATEGNQGFDPEPALFLQLPEGWNGEKDLSNSEKLITVTGSSRSWLYTITGS
jgi:hypothetical protein